jgi:signal transduction histidine kinase
MVVAGWTAAAIVVVSTALTGLPAGGKRAAVLALTAVAVIAWLISLVRSVGDPRLWAGTLLVVGFCGAALQLIRPQGPGFLLAYMAIAGMGLRLPRRAALGCVVAVILVTAAAEGYTSAAPFTAAFGLALGAAFVFLASSFAAVSRDAHARAQALLEQEAATRAAREEAAVLGERSRLARELHDVLAHTLSGLTVQLEGARLLADRLHADHRLVEQIANAQSLARDGMAGAKRAVSTLRGDLTPGPEAITDLVEQARGRGQVVDLTVTGVPHPVAAGVGLTLYRAVQESLTNALKHAGSDARVRVCLHWTETEVTLEVSNTGGTGGLALPSSGYGLHGLAERAALSGGRLDAGPCGDGWRVALRLPGTPVAGAAR